MSSIWEAEWERRKQEDARAVNEANARARNLQRNLNMFRGDNPLPFTTPRNPVFQIPNSTTFNPYTPYTPYIEPSARIRNEVNEIIRRQNLEILKDYGPATEDKFAEWNRRIRGEYDKDAFWRDSQKAIERALAGDAANRAREAALNDARRQIAEYEARRNNVIQLPGQVDDFYNSPMGLKQRQFNATDYGPDSTIARLRRQQRSETVPTWNTVGPQTLDDYVTWLKKQGRNQEAANIEWENRRKYQTQFGETPEQEQNRRRSYEAQNRIDVERGRTVNGQGFEMRRSPLQLTQDAATAEFNRIAEENRRFWNSVDAQNARRNAERNGFNPLLSQSDRNALEAARNRFLNDDSANIRIPDLSSGRNRDLTGNPESGLSRIPQNRTGVNNQVPTGNRFTRNNPAQRSDFDFGGGTGTLTRNRNNGPYNPNGGFFGDDGEWLYDRALRDRLAREIEAGRVQIPTILGGNQANNRQRFSDNQGIQGSRNFELPGMQKINRTGYTGPTYQSESSSSNNRTGGNNNSATTNLQRFGNPFVRGVSIGTGISELVQQGKLYGDAFNSLNDYRNALDALGIRPSERDRILREYGNPEYVNGLKRSVNQAVGSRPFDVLSVDFQYDALQALRRGENPQRFKERYFGPQDREGAELYRMDYKNGPIFAPTSDRWYGPFKIPGSDGYTDKQREGLNDARRRGVGSYYGPGIGGKLSQLGRQISADSNNAYRRLLKEEQRRQQLEKDERRRNRQYWDDLDNGRISGPSQQRRQYIDPETARELQRWSNQDRNPVDPFEDARRRDLQRTEDWNRRNPDFYKDAEYKKREKELEYWFDNDPSKIQSSWDPFRPAPIPDPNNPPDPNYPPLPPGLRYPIWGWEIEATSILDGTGSLIYWYSSYIKNSDLEGDMPPPQVGTGSNGETFISNEGGWQTGRTGIWVLPDLRFSSPPAYVGGDESEIFTEAKYIEKWGVLWTYPYNSPIWSETGNQDKQNEVFRDKRRLESRGKSNPVFGTTTIVKTKPIRGKQPVPDTELEKPPLSEPEDPIMPGCSYMPDKQNPAIVSWWDKLTGQIRQKPIQVHEGVDEGFTHISEQIAQLNKRIEEIAKVLDTDKYNAPQGKVVAPVLGMQAITTVLSDSSPLAPIPLVKTLPQENMIFQAVNHMFSGHHLIGKLQLPVDPNKGADELGNFDRLTPLTVMGYMHKMYNNITGMVGAPSVHQVVDANGVKTPMQFKNQADAMENVHSNTVQMQQDISSLQEAVFKILQNQEMIINMSHKLTYQADFLIKDTGARVKEIMVERPTVMKHGKKPDPLVQTGGNRTFSWETVFKVDKAATSVPTWDKSNELDKLQLGLKTNIEAQKAASSNFYPISKQDTQAIPSLRSRRDGTWESYVKTINDGTEGALYHGVAIPESKIEEIKNGIKKPIVTTDKPFIDGRLTE